MEVERPVVAVPTSQVQSPSVLEQLDVEEEEVSPRVSDVERKIVLQELGTEDDVEDLPTPLEGYLEQGEDDVDIPVATPTRYSGEWTPVERPFYDGGWRRGRTLCDGGLSRVRVSWPQSHNRCDGRGTGKHLGRCVTFRPPCVVVFGKRVLPQRPSVFTGPFSTSSGWDFRRSTHRLRSERAHSRHPSPL